MDGPVGVTQCDVPPGSSFTYNFTVEQPGTYWVSPACGVTVEIELTLFSITVTAVRNTQTVFEANF